MSWHRNFSTGLPCNCGFGKYQEPHQIVASVQPGQSGKGLYFPDSELLHTWSDGRNHNEVRFDDEHGPIKDPVAQLEIGPDGTVKALNDDVAPEELERVLKEHDPRLHMEAEWSLGHPTEPLPTKPEGVDEGRHHNVEISDDKAGVGTVGQ